MPELQMMHEVGVEGDLFNVHPQSPSCQRAGCVKAATLRYTDPHLQTFGKLDELVGWIKLCDGDPEGARAELTALGIWVGAFDPKEKEYSVCRVPVSAMAQLDGLWGKYIWGLKRPESHYKLEDLKDDPDKRAGLANERVRIYSRQWGMYWRASGSGYTMDRTEAGIYSFQDAWDRSHHAGPEKGIEYVTTED